MRVPLTWLRECVDLDPDLSPREIAEGLIRVGLEVETVEALDAGIDGPLVVGTVLDFQEESHSNGRTIRWCTVDVGEGQPRGIVCGARNFVVGERVVVALPGTELPGGFAIAARRTYGHVSDGMICSARELGLGEDHTGILRLPAEAPVGADARKVLGLREDVLDIAVTPDRGYCLSIRGVGREAAASFGAEYRDPAASSGGSDAGLVASSGGSDGGRVASSGGSGRASAEGSRSEEEVVPDGAPGWPVVIADDDGCDTFVALRVTGFDPSAPSPLAISQRVRAGGMRSISLAVDVTNYVMLELGSPLHAYDAAKLTDAIVVRSARPGERLVTLDGTDRPLDPADLLITDGSGPIGIAGVMGGASTEISEDTTDIVVEAAHFDPVRIARSARRHRLPSEASRRFERGVDPLLPLAAAMRAAALLVRFGGGRIAGCTVVGTPRVPGSLSMAADLPARLLGTAIALGEVAEHLTTVGCRVEPVGKELRVTPPSWRPDLTDPSDLVEEVARLHGYDRIPSVLPTAPPGRGLTEAQRLRRRVGSALASMGLVEAPSYPFVGPSSWEVLGFAPEDVRRRALALANPLSDEEPLLRTTLLPGLLTAARRNLGRGEPAVALFEVGAVFLPHEGYRRALPVPRLPVDRRPTDAELDTQRKALPSSPRHLGVILAGDREQGGWWGPGRPASWADAVQVVRDLAALVNAEVEIRAGERAPWHPGRCATVLVSGVEAGQAGELHPRVAAALGLPERTAALEINLDLLLAAAGSLVPAASISTYPVAKEDVALVVPDGVTAADVREALISGAGPLLEEIRLFDVFTGEQIGKGRRSLAFSLRFRAPDRTLTVAEVSAARDSAVAEAGRMTGARLRGT